MYAIGVNMYAIGERYLITVNDCGNFGAIRYFVKENKEGEKVFWFIAEDICKAAGLPFSGIDTFFRVPIHMRDTITLDYEDGSMESGTIVLSSSGVEAFLSGSFNYTADELLKHIEENIVRCTIFPTDRSFSTRPGRDILHEMASICKRYAEGKITRETYGNVLSEINGVLGNNERGDFYCSLGTALQYFSALQEAFNAADKAQEKDFEAISVALKEYKEKYEGLECFRQIINED